MKIVIAAGIYPPDVGGPALYAQGVKESLERSGNEVSLVLFSSFRRYPSGIRHLLYAVKLMNASRGASAILAFDTYSVGVPAVFVGMLRSLPLVIRIGGDFVWESYVERTHDLIPLPEFYHAARPLIFKERIARMLVAWMLRHAELAFNTQWLLEIWESAYQLDPKCTHVVENAIGERFEKPSSSDRTVLLYGRQLALKNTAGFRRAFEAARAGGVDLSLNEGMIPHDELIEKMRSCYAIAVPSISDVAPNSVIDAIRCGKPFLLTRYSGYAEHYKDLGIIIDPLDEGDMVRGIKEIADPAVYERLCTNIANYSEVRTYDDITRELLAILG